MASYPIGDYTPGLAAEDLSSSRHRFVELNSTGGFEVCDAITDIAEGVLENDPTTGLPAAVKSHGFALVEAAAAVNINQYVAPSANGRAQVAVATQYIRGKAITAAAAAGDLFTIRLIENGVAVA